MASFTEFSTAPSTLGYGSFQTLNIEVLPAIVEKLDVTLVDQYARFFKLNIGTQFTKESIDHLEQTLKEFCKTAGASLALSLNGGNCAESSHDLVPLAGFFTACRSLNEGKTFKDCKGSFILFLKEVVEGSRIQNTSMVAQLHDSLWSLRTKEVERLGVSQNCDGRRVSGYPPAKFMQTVSDAEYNRQINEELGLKEVKVLSDDELGLEEQEPKGWGGSLSAVYGYAVGVFKRYFPTVPGTGTGSL